MRSYERPGAKESFFSNIAKNLPTDQQYTPLPFPGTFASVFWYFPQDPDLPEADPKLFEGLSEAKTTPSIFLSPSLESKASTSKSSRPYLHPTENHITNQRTHSEQSRGGTPRGSTPQLLARPRTPMGLPAKPDFST